MTDEIDSFAAMFAGPPSAARRGLREERARKERRTQLTEGQRRRVAVRTTQLNFRCSPAFKEAAFRVARHLDCSIADMMEIALEELARARGISVDSDDV